MTIAVTGRSRIDAFSVDDAIAGIIARSGPMRFVNDLERMTVAAAGSALADAGLSWPAGDDAIGLYLGIDDAVEVIKDDFFSAILRDGLLGASPLAFPYTSPNAFAARASIILDLRGESITFSINNSAGDVIQYAVVGIMGGHTRKAVAVCIRTDEAAGGRYLAECLVIERRVEAEARGARIRTDIDLTAASGGLS